MDAWMEIQLFLKVIIQTKPAQFFFRIYNFKMHCPLGLVVASATDERRVLGSIPQVGQKVLLGFYLLKLYAHNV